MANIVLRNKERNQRLKYVIPRPVQRKLKRLTWKERLWVYWDQIALSPSLLLFPYAIVTDAIQDQAPNWNGAINTLAYIFGLGGIIGMIVIATMRGMEGGQKSWMPYKRRRVIAFRNRNRQIAQHSKDRLARMRDVVYMQYSTWCEREGGELKFIVLEHSREHEDRPHKRLWPWDQIWLTHTKSRKRLTSRGTYEDSYAASMALSDPTLDSADEMMRKTEELAEELENKAYNEALEKRKLDRLALITVRPAGPPMAEGMHFASEHDDNDKWWD